MGFEPWEPEETIGKLWHNMASRWDAPPVFPDAAVTLPQVMGRLGVFYRGLGGDHSVDMRAARDVAARHRLSFRRRLATEAEALPRATFDGEVLRLPETLALFPDAAANGAAYLWLTAMSVAVGQDSPPQAPGDDPLSRDLAQIAGALRAVDLTLGQAPGLARLYAELSALSLARRRAPRLPATESAIEQVIRHLLGDPADLTPDAAQVLARINAARAGDASALDARAPHGYRPLRPVEIWVMPDAVQISAADQVETRDTDGPPEEGQDGKMMRARRRQTDQAERRDSLILHKFEAILSWAEFLNLNRRVEDDDLDDAKKAADDQDELNLGQLSKAPATRLKLHLDLSPEDADRERLAGVHIYPEWDARRGVYLPAHVRVLESRPEPAPESDLIRDPAAARRIRAVRRQFEALRPGRITTTGHRDGEDLDTELAVRAAGDLAAMGEDNDRIWRQSRPMARDLAVSILLDVSRSTESAVTGRAVIDIEREALTALCWGLHACGDRFALNAFSSLRRERVYVSNCKNFDEPMSRVVEQRVAALRPQFYTRLGAGLRHASAGLASQGSHRRLLLVITDGKPNDLDHYEGRHGIEDSARAIREARRAGHSVFGITVDRDGKSWFPRIFGQGGFALFPDPNQLTTALPHIYRQLVGR
ncbi:nitric oxide reductase activation protein NorD [Paracoccus sp. (in: a-proteobacteria)]|uniref:nitric oxide reductase activation protein NorD n=1 Tax=Paracoccus sp. TaxID=267 RepID=UPI0026E027BE|nr:VWA domain-containing protein [Paracoccus sp. (in: a-proteobacteria)]MDO5647869.1 VWA domain-containing protein [Paracoccus sp. (in: a-proteobacteria)]